jgi:hypothetical protein
MKIIKEDIDQLIFEDSPNTKLDKTAISITIKIVIFAIIINFLAKFFLGEVKINIPTVTTLIFAFLSIGIFWLFDFSFFSLSDKYFRVKVEVDKKANSVSMSNLIPPWFFWSWIYWQNNHIEIPIQNIKKIEYHTWTPLFYNIPLITGPKTSLGKYVFILNDNTTATFYTYGLFHHHTLFFC